MTGENDIVRILVREGSRLLRAPRAPIQFTGDPHADRLLNDLERFPHAFVLGCVMDRQVKSERAWLIPHRFAEHLGGFSIARLRRMSLIDIRGVMSRLQLHRFPEEMAANFHGAVERITTEYGGRADAIWHDEPSSATLVYRFLQFRGVGPKIATMAANILAREFKIPFQDYYSVDISADVHVRRVFTRLRLVDERATPEQVVYKARALHPAFPGLLDTGAFRVGRQWCKPRQPVCGACFMRSVCPSGDPTRAPT